MGRAARLFQCPAVLGVSWSRRGGLREGWEGARNLRLSSCRAGAQHVPRGGGTPAAGLCADAEGGERAGWTGSVLFREASGQGQHPTPLRRGAGAREASQGPGPAAALTAAASSQPQVCSAGLRGLEETGWATRPWPCPSRPGFVQGRMPAPSGRSLLLRCPGPGRQLTACVPLGAGR